MDTKCGQSVSSRLRDLAKFLATCRGDLANVTGPVSFLASSSVVEVGNCWAQRPAVFAAPAREACPEKRSLLVLQMILVALRTQLYLGGASPKTSLKRPLNAFLGELFLARWSDDEAKASTRLVAEQVSHHPPITAMHIADEANGVRADGYARVEMSYNGNVEVRQVGHAVLHLDRFGEDYLFPLPDVTVHGFMSGRLYPEVKRTYTIVGSNGLISEIRFSGAGMVWGKRNSFTATTYRRHDQTKTPLFVVEGIWSQGWTVRDMRGGGSGVVIDEYDVEAPENASPAAPQLDPLSQQDPWESRRAWAPVLSALVQQDYRTASAEKTRVEQAQRQMRAREAQEGIQWEPLFFKSVAADQHEVFHRLAAGDVAGWGMGLCEERTRGVWKVDEERLRTAQKPFRGSLMPGGGLTGR